MESCIGWIGGKRLLCKAILEQFPTDEVGRYIEVFGGAGWVLFAKKKKSGQMEVYNDINGNLVNLFRCVKYHCNEVQKELDWLLTSREQFFDCLAQLDTRGLTDIQRAARFFYTVKISFGCDQRTYATSSKMIDTAAAHLEKVKERLRGVNIEHKDFADLIQVYDRKNALFYLDPPYVGMATMYHVAKEQEAGMGNNTQSRKWALVINNPLEAALDHSAITKILQKFAPAYPQSACGGAGIPKGAAGGNRVPQPGRIQRGNGGGPAPAGVRL